MFLKAVKFVTQKKLFAFILVMNALVIAQSNPSAADSLSRNKIPADDSVAIKKMEFSRMPKWHDMITNIPTDWSRFFTVSFRENKIPLYLTVSALTAATIATDKESWIITRKNHDANPFATKFDEFWTEFGDGRTQFGLAAAFGIYGLITDDARAVRTASQIVQTVLAAGSVVQVLKHVTGRQTPNTASSPTGNWVFFPNQIDYAKRVSNYDAFPSGHVTTTLATVIVIAENYPEVWWIRPAGYIATALVAYGMVGTGIHWYSDYPLAVAMGYTFGMIAAHPEKIPDSIAGTKKLNIMPMLVEKGIGVSIGYSF